VRDENGRFVKGQSGNPKGRSKKERETRFYEITLSSVSYDDWKEIVYKAVAQAKRGDPTARKWLSDYLIGEPEKNVKGDFEILIRYADLDSSPT